MSRVVALLLMEGCSGKFVKMNPSELDQLRNEPEIRAVHLPAPTPSILTPSAAMNIGQLVHPALGALQAQRAAVSLGAQWTARYGIEDPTPELKNHFLTRVGAEHGLPDIESVPMERTTDTMSRIWAIHPTTLVFLKGYLVCFI